MLIYQRVNKPAMGIDGDSFYGYHGIFFGISIIFPMFKKG
jgi:hypothetical protein